MFKAWIHPDTLDRAIRPVTALVEEAELHLAEGGIRINTVDSAKVGAVSIDLLAEAFHGYESDGGEISVDLARMQEIIRQTGDQGQAMMEINDEDYSLELSIGEYEFDFALLVSDGTQAGTDPHDLSGPAKVEIDGGELSKAINIGSMFSDQIRMGIDRKRELFYMEAKGDNDGMHVTFDQDELDSLKTARAYGLYSLDYLEKMVRAIPGDTSVKMELGEEYPLKIQYEIADGNGRINYGLAPRIQN